MRLDRALVTDLRTVLRSRAVSAFLLAELAAGVVLVWRRGEGMLSTVLLVWLGMGCLAFFAWWAGRHRLAQPQADPLPAPRPRAAFALMGVIGMVLFGFDISPEAGYVLLVCGVGGWLWAALRSGGLAGSWARLTRDVRPFVPMLLLIGLPRLIVGGPWYLMAAVLALPSGVGQQLVYLLGLYAPLEAVWRRRAAAAAVAAALLFGLVHVPLLLPENDGDLIAAFANAVIFQASVGIIAVLAYQRHRAAVPIGAAHALAIA